MSQNYQAIDATLHATTALRDVLSTEHLHNQHFVPLSGPEFAPASSSFPVLFAKDPHTGNFRAVGLTGLVPGESLIFTAEKTHAEYLPLDIRRYPFAVAISAENSEFTLCIDQNTQLIDPEGTPVLTENGELGNRAKEAKMLIQETLRQEHLTNEMLIALDDMELIIPAGIKVDVNGKKQHLNGLYLVDQQRLKALPEADLLTLRQNGYLSAINAHIHSLSQLGHLTKLCRAAL